MIRYTASYKKIRPILWTGRIFLAGARGIEPRSKVLETFILTVVLCPYGWRVFSIAATSMALLCYTNGHEIAEVVTAADRHGHRLTGCG